MLRNRKFQIVISAFIFLAAALYLNRASLGETLMVRIGGKRLQDNMQRMDALTADGLHVVLCGAGAPLPDPKRSGPCAMVIAGETVVVIDSGSGGSRNLLGMGFPQGEIDALLLTHFHSDHIDGLGELAMQRWVNTANTSSLPVYGPEGVAQVVDGFNMAYQLDAGYRHAHHGDAVAPLSGAGMKAIEIAAPPLGQQTAVLEQDGLKVTMFRVNHAPISPAVGYRFDYQGRSIVISGDTTKSDNLQRIAQDTDLLVHEALSSKLVMAMNKIVSKAGNTVGAKITHDIIDYHTSPVQAAQIAKAANVKHLLYYHIVPALIVPGSQATFLEGVSDVYKGGVTLGQDGSMISLPSNSDKVIAKQ